MERRALAAGTCAVFASLVASCGGPAVTSAPPSGIEAAPPRAAEDSGAAPDGIGLGSFDAGADARAPSAGRRSAKEKNGRLPPEQIQAVVRASFGEYRKCYEHGLRASPSLQGRVTVKFVIGLDGRVVSAADEKSDWPDAEVVRCVVDEFRKLRFPKPDGGIVTVVYPLIFEPGN